MRWIIGSAFAALLALGMAACEQEPMPPAVPPPEQGDPMQQPPPEEPGAEDYRMDEQEPEPDPLGTGDPADPGDPGVYDMQ